MPINIKNVIKGGKNRNETRRMRKNTVVTRIIASSSPIPILQLMLSGW
jgi:hypothetical protein